PPPTLFPYTTLFRSSFGTLIPADTRSERLGPAADSAPRCTSATLLLLLELAYEDPCTLGLARKAHQDGLPNNSYSIWSLSSNQQSLGARFSRRPRAHIMRTLTDRTFCFHPVATGACTGEWRVPTSP